jgi:hypothetical protein
VLAPRARHSLAAWGSAPEFIATQKVPALKARFTASRSSMIRPIEARFQRLSLLQLEFLGRCPRLT